MPFFDDSGPKPEQEQHFLWRSIALVGDQLERMVFLNILWAGQLLPALLAWAVAALPEWGKLTMLFYSAIILIPMTGLSYAVLMETSRGVPISLELGKESWNRVWKASFTNLLPLFSLFYLLWLIANLAQSSSIILLDALCRLMMMMLGVLSVYWGCLFVEQPERNALWLLLESWKLFWRNPGATLVTVFLCLVAGVLGIVSIGGFFLIVPVVIVLIQIQNYLQLGHQKL